MANEQGIHYDIRYDKNGKVWQRYDCFLCGILSDWIPQDEMMQFVTTHLQTDMHKNKTESYANNIPKFWEEQ